MMRHVRFLIRRPEVLFVGVFAVILVVVRGASALHILTPNVSLAQGLATYWKLDGNGTDSSGNGLSLTLSGTSPTSDHTGKAGAATGFNGASSYGTVPNSPLINTAASYPEKSINLWFQSNDTSTRQYLYEQGDSASGIGIYIYNGYVIGQVWWPDGSGGTSTSAIDYTISTGVWYNVIFVYSDGNFPNFIVNDQVATPSSGKTYSAGLVNGTTDPGGVGAAFGTSYFQDNTTAVSPGSAGGYFFNGSMSDIRTYNRALTNADIATLESSPGSTLKIASGEKGLIGWWKLDGNAKDSTPYSNDGTKYGGGTWVADRYGNNGAYSSTGNALIEIPDATRLNPQTFTLGVWVQSTSSTGYDIIDKSDADGSRPYYLYLFNGKVCLQIEDHAHSSAQVCSNSVIQADNTWHYVTATRTAQSQIAIYLDGVLQQSLADPITSSTANTDTLRIGDGSTGANIPAFRGPIDDVRLYDRVLTQAEITSQYKSYNSQISLGGSGASGSVSLQKGLVGWWQMNGNLKDGTPYSDTATTNTATLTSDREGMNGRAYDVPANGYITMADQPQLNITGPFTIAIWIKPSTASQPANATVLAKDSSGTDTNYRLAYDGNSVVFKVTATDGFQYSVGGVTSLTDTSKWYFLTGVNTGTQLQLYINGVLDTSGAGPAGKTLLTTTNSLRIGSGSTYGFRGSVDGARVYNRALNAAEVAALYSSYD